MPRLVPLRFKVKALTKYEENVSIVGSVGQLGLWNTQAKHRLQTFSETYPVWQSQNEVMIQENSQVEFKCVIINKWKEVKWETGQNRRVSIQNQETVVEMEYNIEALNIFRITRDDQSGSSSNNRDEYELREIAYFGLANYNDDSKSVTKQLFNVRKDQKLQLSQISQQPLVQWSKSRLFDLKGIWYINHPVLLNLVNKSHNHMLNICYDTRHAQAPSFQELENCKVLLFKDSQSVMQYSKHMSLQGHHVWNQRGCMIVISIYGLQLITVSKLQNLQTCPNTLSNQALFDQYDRLTKLLQYSHKLLLKRIECDVMQMQNVSPEDTLIIYSDPNILRLSQNLKNKTTRVIQNYPNFMILTSHPESEVLKVFKGTNRHIGVISPAELSLSWNSKTTKLAEADHSDLKQIKQRLLAENTFDLVLDAPYGVVLSHKYPRLFEVQRPLYQNQIKRFNRLRFNVFQSTIRITLIDMNDILGGLLKINPWKQVVLIGSDSFLDQLNKRQFQDVIIRRIINILSVGKMFTV